MPTGCGSRGSSRRSRRVIGPGSSTGSPNRGGGGPADSRRETRGFGNMPSPFTRCAAAGQWRRRSPSSSGAIAFPVSASKRIWRRRRKLVAVSCGGSCISTTGRAHRRALCEPRSPAFSSLARKNPAFWPPRPVDGRVWDLNREHLAMLTTVRAVRRLITGKDDVASLQQQLVALKAEGADASVEIERLKSERALAANYEEATAIDGAVARQAWIVEHCASALPELELRLAACRAADQAAALAKHRGILIGLYPRLKAAILAAVEAQEEALAAREAACKEIGEAAVSRNLPAIAYAGFLTRDLVVGVW